LNPEIDWKQRYDDLLKVFLLTLEQLDTESFGLMSYLKQKKNEVLNNGKANALTPKPNRAQRRRIEREALKHG
jgi:hypothetical protein